MSESEALPTRTFQGWGRATSSVSQALEPADQAAVADLQRAGAARGLLARGLGRSYGDAAMNAGGALVLSERLGAIGPVSADGVVTVGAGTSIDALLAAVVPQGWFVPVSPGTRQVTIGGAIAADIHGKNHHRDGTFGMHVQELTLVLASGDAVQCGPQLEPETFWATVGGMGLTGVITSATIRLLPIASDRLVVDTDRFSDLDGLLEALKAGDQHYPYSVAWIDLVSTGRSAGRSVLTRGRFATAAEAGVPNIGDFAPRAVAAAPPLVPSGLLNHRTLRAFNEVWFRKAPAHRREELQSIAWFFHPLDGVPNWNTLYGPRGFLQWQIVLPDSATDLLRSTVASMASERVPSFLTVLKRFGPQNPAPLSFPRAGWTLTADIPVGDPALAAHLDRMDEQVVEAGGRIYLAKDSRMAPHLLDQMYPNLDAWRAVRDRLDPDRRMNSDLARRLNLLG